jgi:hypothetical protein
LGAGSSSVCLALSPPARSTQSIFSSASVYKLTLSTLRVSCRTMFPPCSRPALSWLLFSLLLAASGAFASSSKCLPQPLLLLCLRVRPCSRTAVPDARCLRAAFLHAGEEDTQLVGDSHPQVSNRRLLLVASNASLVSNRVSAGMPAQQRRTWKSQAHCQQTLRAGMPAQQCRMQRGQVYVHLMSLRSVLACQHNSAGRRSLTTQCACAARCCCMQSCPGGIAPVKCKVDPCLRRKCDEDETCVVHNCFRCKATCRKNRAPSVDPPQQDPASQCSDGSRPVRCLVNPCATIWCRADEMCEANYVVG